jgi:voltage-gated potassium channel
MHHQSIASSIVSSDVTLSWPRVRRRPITLFLRRVAIAAACLFITAFLVYIERDGYHDANGTPITMLDAVYYASVSLSTTGYGDIAPFSESARLVNIVFITPLRFIFLITLVSTTVEILTARSRDEWRTRRWRSTVNNHIVIIGYGVKGRSAAQSLTGSGVQANTVVVVDPSPQVIEEANESGFLGVVGDGGREETMRAASVETAGQVVVALDRDDASVLAVLTARRLAPNARIVAAVRESTNSALLRQSGADVVVLTAESAGHLMGLSLNSPAAGDFVEDLLETRDGLEIVERTATGEDLGSSSQDLLVRGELLVAVVRNGVTHRFDSGLISTIQAGDILLVIHQGRRPL